MHKDDNKEKTKDKEKDNENDESDVKSKKKSMNEKYYRNMKDAHLRNKQTTIHRSAFTAI